MSKVKVSIQTRKGKTKTSYRVQFERAGIRVSKSFSSEDEAEDFVFRIKRDPNLVNSLLNKKPKDKSLSTNLNDVIYRYLNEVGCEPSSMARINFWRAEFGVLDMLKLTDDDVFHKLEKLKAKGLAPATINRYKASLASVYKFARDKRIIKIDSPTRKLKNEREDNARTRFLSIDEQNRLLAACKLSTWPQLHLLTKMAIVSGARRTELLSLKWTDVDFKNKSALLHKTKNGDKRTIFFNDEIIEEMRQFNRFTQYIFQHQDHAHQHIKNFDGYWYKALKIAGIVDFKFHDLRHTAASRLAANGASLLTIAAVLGHKSISMTQRYAHLCNEHLGKAVREAANYG